ncbi:sushi, von Willebrand factor type A, EGF and pentraxin domain-containing protein 1-like [Ylistrum balloti]|uniref:sushi, von Willebrand factor type A, EGF and pentraxin domain-containing protein 1-like n=1 Tax=Ylistrum balloti TaxID=509963 RepID=UPI002905F555|nr:sushi, von Willebrand factor type A, EGF and pentraxin domain-containing protein 1-like [Ylistrum balloti]
MEVDILLLLVFSICTNTRGVELEVPQFVSTHYSSTTGYRSIREIGLYSCARQCGLESGCNSFTYNLKNHRCLLHEDSVYTALGNYEAYPEYVYGDRATIVSDESLMGKCREHDCPNYTSCIRLTSASTVCVITACGPMAELPYFIDYDNISSTMSPVGVTRYLPCDPGYIGHREVVCLPTGQWSEPEVKCEDCGDPPSVSDAVVTVGSTTIGSSRKYECSQGTTSFGSGVILCQDNGQWSVPSLKCVPDCVISTHMHHAYTTATVAPAGRLIHYKCNTGYHQLTGTGNRYCNTDGLWEALDIICSEVDCGSPPLPQVGAHITAYHQLTYIYTITYGCDTGLVSTQPGKMTLNCQSDGHWSPVEYQCL